MNKGLLIFILLDLILYLLFMVRNIWTATMREKTSNIISEYIDYLIKTRKYNMKIEYYDVMRISYNKYLFDFRKWNYIYFFKKEYRTLIKDFLKYQEKQKEIKKDEIDIIDVIYNDFE